MSGNFSLELNEDQIQLQKWVHDFAEDVIRPAAEEWDEREEFPWPIVQEAANIGLYSIDFMAQAMMADPTGLTMPIAIEELFWGDAGIGLAIMGSGLAAAGIAGNGTPEQVFEWIPQCYGTPEKVQLGAFCVSEPDAGSDVSSLRTRAVYDEAKDEWVLNGTKAWITNGGIANIHVVVAAVDPELKGRGQASFIIPPNTPGLSQGQMVRIEQDILGKNDSLAGANRTWLAERGILALNLVSSPGSGKTTLLCRTIRELAGRTPVAVIEGDQQTEFDAERIRETGARALQINTGKGCHLDAHMVGQALPRLELAENSLLLIENVGNLVCPAAFDLGEAHKVVILSVTEGEDKPLKYPDMFAAADLMLLNKVDLLPHLTFDAERAIERIERVDPLVNAVPIRCFERARARARALMQGGVPAEPGPGWLGSATRTACSGKAPGTRSCSSSRCSPS